MSAAAVVPVSQVEMWVRAGLPLATDILADEVTMQAALVGLRFYFVRRAIAMAGGSITAAAAKIGIHRNSLTRCLQNRTGKLPRRAALLAENWATWLASQGASIDQADKVFAGALVKAGIDRAQGNQCRAARILGIHRNSVRRIATAVVEQRGEGRA